MQCTHADPPEGVDPAHALVRGTGYVRCDRPAAFLYTYPGHSEAAVCAQHADKLRAVAREMGADFKIRPIDEVSHDV